MKVRVVIDRGQGNIDRFDGHSVAETTTHYLVTTSVNPVGEWFAKQSKNVWCRVYGK